MTKADFIAFVAEEIEDAVMRAHGAGDWLSDDSPDERAWHIASLLPDYAFTNPSEEKP